MIELVPVRPEDEAFLYKLYISTRHDEAAAWGSGNREADAFFAMQYEFQQRSYRLQFPAAEHSIIQEQTQPIGRILVWQDQGTTLLVDISLLPEYRGQGIGSSLIRSLQAEAKACGSVLQLHVFRDNPAIRLYESLGFLVTEQGDVYHKMEWHPEKEG